MDDQYEEITVEIPDDLYQKLKAATDEFNKEYSADLTPEEYASKILEDAYKSGEFENIVLKEISNTQDTENV